MDNTPEQPVQPSPPPVVTSSSATTQQPAPTTQLMGGLRPVSQAQLPLVWVALVVSFLSFVGALFSSDAYSLLGVITACYASIVAGRLGRTGLRVAIIVAGLLNLIPFVIFLTQVMS